MRISTSLALVVLTAVASAQSPLTTLSGGTNQGNIGNNIFFDLQINQTVTINRIDFLCGANTLASAAGGLEIFLGPTTYLNNHLTQSLWTPVATVTGLTVAPSQMATANLTIPFALGPGNYGLALRAIGCNHGYTNGDGNATPGSGTNQTFTRVEMVFRGGAQQNTPWLTGVNTPRIFNGGIHYTPGGNPIAVAAWERYGKGCYEWYHSFYETYLNPSTSFDMKAVGGINSLRLRFIGSGYQVGPFVRGTGTFYTPTAAATNLNLGNNLSATFNSPFPIPYPAGGPPQVTTSLTVSDNGFISPGTSNASLGSPSVAAFLGGAARWAPAWFDFDPALGGQINWEVDPSGTQLYVSWIAVPDVTLPATSNTMQVMFSVTGDVEFRYGTMSLSHGGIYPCLVGWTPGAPSMDPDERDISATTVPFTTGPTDNPPLALDLLARPQLSTTMALTTTNIPPSTAIGANMIGMTQIPSPGLSLAIINMPGCFAHLDVGSAIVIPAAISSATSTLNIPIPNNPTLNNAVLYSQTITFTPGYNTFGAITSNGVRIVIGSL